MKMLGDKLHEDIVLKLLKKFTKSVFSLITVFFHVTFRICTKCNSVHDKNDNSSQNYKFKFLQ